MEGWQIFVRISKFVLLLVASWVVMTFTHELGHLVGGICSGGVLVSADLRPWRLPYSIFDPDPRPLVTLWSGPLMGVAVPLILAGVIRKDWAWFIAHFCLLANGVYLLTAWFSGQPHLDTPRLLQHGASPSVLAVYCALTIAIGYTGFRQQCRKMLQDGSD